MEHEIELKTSTHISFLEMSFSNKVKWFWTQVKSYISPIWIYSTAKHDLLHRYKTNYIFNVLNTYHELAYRHLGFLFSFPIMLFKKIIGPIFYSIFTFRYLTIYYNVSNHILSVQVLLIRIWYKDLFSSIRYLPLIDFFSYCRLSIYSCPPAWYSCSLAWLNMHL